MSVAGASSPPDLALQLERYTRYIRRVLSGFGLRDHELDDASQEVLLVALRRRASFAGRSSVETWLYGICRHVAYGERRRAYRRRELLTDELPEQHEPGTPHTLLDRDHRRRALRHALESLGEIQRDTLLLYEIGGMSANDVAKFVRSAPRTVRARVYNARRELRRRLRRPDTHARMHAREEPWVPPDAADVLSSHGTPHGPPLRISFCDDGLCVASVGHVMMTRWNGAPTLPRVRALGRHLALLAREEPRRIAFIDCVDAAPQLPDRRTRFEIRRQVHHFGPRIQAYSPVFFDSTLRRIAFGFILAPIHLADASFDATACSSVDDAVHWMKRQHALWEVPPERVLAGFEELRCLRNVSLVTPAGISSNTPAPVSGEGASDTSV